MKFAQLKQWSDCYRGAQDAKHPYISPLYADLTGFPPVLTFVGDQEVILDDTLRFVARARRAGVVVHNEIGRGMQHDWPLTLPWLDQSAAAWNVIARFVTAHA